MFDYRILLVDDNEDVRNVIKYACERSRIKVIEADCGKKAIEILEKERFSMVVTDLKMPDLDGTQLIKWVKNRYPDVYTIVITGYADQYALEELIDIGMDDFIKKPFNAVEIVVKIKSVLKQMERMKLLINDINSIQKISNDMITGLEREKNIYAEKIKYLEKEIEKIKKLKGI